jgi:hypothetical protein
MNPKERRPPVLSKSSDESEGLIRTITQAESDLQTMDAGSEEYAKALAHLERLYKLKTQTVSKQIDPNTVVLVIGNLLGILILVGYEHSHVIGSRAIGLVGKLR